MLAELTSGITAIRPGRTNMPVVDARLIVAVSILVMFGWLMVYSASIALSDAPRYAGYSQYHFVFRHGIYIVIGLFAALCAATVSMETWQKAAIPIFLFATLLLVLVLIPGIGKEVNGARRWLPLGLVNFQPSEFMKLAILLYAADYTVRKQDHLKQFWRGFAPMAFALALVGVLLLMEPDLGASIVIVLIAIGILFIGGISGGLFAGLLGFLLSGFLMLIWLSPWRRERVFAYLDPWNPENAYGSAYQLSHSLIAFGRGEWFGVGLGASIEKLHYLPEAHTDFIAAVVGEELGFVGLMFLLGLFVFIALRGFEIGRQAIALERIFNGLVAQGVVLWFGVQAFINIGVCLGLLPTKGLTLPMVSYGGSGIVMNLVAVALLLRVDYENRCMMRGKRI